MRLFLLTLLSLFALSACGTMERDTLCGAYTPTMVSLAKKVEAGKLDDADIALVDRHRVDWRQACTGGLSTDTIREHAEPIMRLEAER